MKQLLSIVRLALAFRPRRSRTRTRKRRTWRRAAPMAASGAMGMDAKRRQDAAARDGFREEAAPDAAKNSFIKKCESDAARGVRRQGGREEARRRGQDELHQEVRRLTPSRRRRLSPAQAPRRRRSRAWHKLAPWKPAGPGAARRAVRCLRHAVRRLQRRRRSPSACSPAPASGSRVLWRDKQIEYTRLTLDERPDRAAFATAPGPACASPRAASASRSTPAPRTQLMSLLPAIWRLPREPRGAADAQAARRARRHPAATATPTCSAVVVQCRLRRPARSGAERRRRRPLQDRSGHLRPRHRSARSWPPREVLFVSSNCWDAIGATWFGYTTLWVNRFGLPLDELGAAPTRIGTSPARRARLLRLPGEHLP